ncbi:Phage-related baseplate assembly protein [Roseivivax halotolerans]|uniref:Phage-related baseplate assembly protein n=1 Tax=Roseivivax halotolerans TaxID=93684 RepID=A0A1I5W3Y8_9RHOB|nr:baseplate J/gp47 family protein [Roseivivax halotolerans]SFQ14448.1 Phage-related baseplate assembly protein [Roseivivax halotolerans]
MSAYTAVPLDRLPPPEIVQVPEFQALFDEMRAAAIAAEPDLAEALMLESEPATKVLRVCAYYRMLDHAEFNDRARGNMLAFATGADLEHLGAPWGVARLVVDPGDPDAIPPIEPTYEDDTSLRRRIQLAPEGFTTAGSEASYLFHALSASGEVRDAAVESPAPGDVVVTVLSQNGDGTPDQALLDAVEAAISADDVRPLTDLVSVQAPNVIGFEIEAELILRPGPDGAVVEAAARAALEAMIAETRRLGVDIRSSAIFAALHQDGVAYVELTKPAADIVVSPSEVAHLTSEPILTIGGRDV